MRKIFAAAVVVASLAAATAADARITDRDFIAANRCRGLAGAEALGKIDTAGLDALLRAETRGRAQFVADEADKARADAERQARRAANNDAEKARLTAERATLCDTVSQGGGSAGVVNTAQ